MWEKNKILAVGDLVYHILYGKGWLGIIIEIEEIEVGLSSGRASALVHMVPGSEYGSHFDKAFSKKEEENFLFEESFFSEKKIFFFEKKIFFLKKVYFLRSKCSFGKIFFEERFLSEKRLFYLKILFLQEDISF